MERSVVRGESGETDVVRTSFRWVLKLCNFYRSRKCIPMSGVLFL